MDLRTYLFTHRMTASAMARKLGVTVSYMGLVVRLKTPPSRSLARLIEIMTNGEVTETELLDPWKERKSA
jgi:DNA-binding transcriptional regulator YdaS (Cro superfamily)